MVYFNMQKQHSHKVIYFYSQNSNKRLCISICDKCTKIAEFAKFNPKTKFLVVDNLYRKTVIVNMNFSHLQLHGTLLHALQSRGFEKPTPIQEATIPLALGGKDIIACARTGSGKTLAFLLPIYHSLLQNPESLKEKKSKVLIIGPTRELVIQIQEEAKQLSKEIHSLAIFGGSNYNKQKEALKNAPHTIVATPGRLLDYLKSKDADLSAISHVVLDEADRMLDMGFIEDVHQIIKKTPTGRKVYLFSATLAHSAIYSMWEYMLDPEEVFINPELIDHTAINQEVLHLGKEEKLAYLVQHIESINADPIILFTNTRRYVDTLVENLNYHSIRARGLSGTVNQKKRIEILNDFKQKKFRVLVATDVASRGLHIEDVQMVINYDIPPYPESYVHRIGRTARAGKSGSVLNVCSELDYESLEKIEEYLKCKLTIANPDERFLENLSFIKIKDFVSTEKPYRKKNEHRKQSRERSKHPHRKTDRNRSYQSSPRKHQRPQHFKSGQKRTQGTESADKSFSQQAIRAVVPRHRQKTLWQRFLSFLGKKEKPIDLQISERTRQILEMEAKQDYKRTANSKKNYRKPYSKKSGRRRSL